MSPVSTGPGALFSTTMPLAGHSSANCIGSFLHGGPLKRGPLRVQGGTTAGGMELPAIDEAQWTMMSRCTRSSASTPTQQPLGVRLADPTQATPPAIASSTSMPLAASPTQIDHLEPTPSSSLSLRPAVQCQRRRHLNWHLGRRRWGIQC